MKVVLHEEAIAESEEAAEWHSRQRKGLGKVFMAEVKRCLKLLRSRPERFPILETMPYHAGVHRVLMSRFPYKIVFEIMGNELQVLAIAHGSRKPNYWLSRRKSK